MHRTRHLTLPLPLALFLALPCLAAESPTVARLREKGLAKSGLYFVIEEEKPAIARWKAARSVLADYQAAIDKKSQSDDAASGAVNLADRRAELEETLAQLDEQIGAQGAMQPGNQGLGMSQGMGAGGPGRAGFSSGMGASPLTAQRNMVRSEIARITSMQRSAGTADAAAEKKANEARAEQARQEARKALADVRADVDVARKKYESLGSDPAVRAAFRALEKEKMAGMKLGPSTEFKSMVKSLEKAERVVLGKSTTSSSTRKRGRTRG